MDENILNMMYGRVRVRVKCMEIDLWTCIYYKYFALKNSILKIYCLKAKVFFIGLVLNNAEIIMADGCSCVYSDISENS